MDAITAKLPENGQPDAKAMAQIDAVAKKNGFASAQEYNDVTDNIGMVIVGRQFDDQGIRGQDGRQSADRG